jgi:putative DNA methylase
MTYRKKLIEVALPLVAINAASAREKSISYGHPSTLHLWWARRPLAACRAVLFASLVDDPSEHPEEFPTEQAQEKERERLFRLIEELVKWENSNNENVLQQARAEILKSTGGNPPPVLAKSTLFPLFQEETCDTFRARDTTPGIHLTSLT